jgi:hypothetical protein
MLCKAPCIHIHRIPVGGRKLSNWNSENPVLHILHDCARSSSRNAPVYGLQLQRTQLDGTLAPLPLGRNGISICGMEFQLVGASSATGIPRISYFTTARAPARATLPYTEYNYTSRTSNAHPHHAATGHNRISMSGMEFHGANASWPRGIPWNSLLHIVCNNARTPLSHAQTPRQITTTA